MRTGKIVNLKKGQFLSPEEMGQVVKKATAAGVHKLLLTERGTTFGYNNLVVDMRGLKIMAETGDPVVFDATHSVQLPGGAGHASSGQPKFIAPLSCAAAGAGVDGIFVEVHEAPERALSDGANALRLDLLAALWRKLNAIDRIVRA